MKREMISSAQNDFQISIQEHNGLWDVFKDGRLLASCADEATARAVATKERRKTNPRMSGITRTP